MDSRDPEAIGSKILDLRKTNPSIPITEIADLIMNPLIGNNVSENGNGDNKKS